MDDFKPRNFKKGPEAIIQAKIIRKLTLMGWFCKETYGNMYQSGFPDVFACHSQFGQRWVEVKQPKGYSFTPAQMETFPKLVANGSGVWILTSDDDSEINKLFKPCNWYMYL